MNGAAESAKYRQRTFALEQSLSALNRLGCRLRALLEPPEMLIRGLCREGSSLPDYFERAEKLTAQMRFDRAWRSAVLESGLTLTESDRLLIIEAGEIIGKSDSETQLERLNLLFERLESEITDSKTEAAEKSRLCRTLWGLAGAWAAVMLL